MAGWACVMVNRGVSIMDFCKFST
eukprot:SAG11_NODE_54298_length_101_cov_45.500000_1_plen_23_part_10